MASQGYVETLLNAISDGKTKNAVTKTFEYVLNNLRLGLLGDQEKAENFRGYRFDVTTSTTANQEFSIQHGMGQTPTIAVPFLPLNVENAQTVPLTVSRVADNGRIYLKSSSTGASIHLYVEA